MHRICGLIVLICAGPLQAVADEPEAGVPLPEVEGRELLSTLRAALDQWEADVEFRSTFRYDEGYARSVADGLAGRMDEELGAARPLGVIHVTGEYHKRGEHVRMRWSYEKPPAPVSAASPQGATDTGRIVTHVSFEEACNDEVFGTYLFPIPTESGVKRQFNQFDLIPVRDRKHPKRPAIPGPWSSRVLSPLAPWKNGNVHPLWLAARTRNQQEVKAELVRLTGGRVKVVLSGVISGLPSERQVLIRLDETVPVVERIEDRSTFSNGDTDEVVVVLSDFVECPGGPVARRMRHVHRGRTGIVTTGDWVSEDLGSVPPTDADFVIAVRADALIHAQTVPPIRDGVRRFRFSNLDESDVGDRPPITEQELESQKLAATSPPPRSALRWWLIVGGFLTITALGTFTVLRRVGARG